MPDPAGLHGGGCLSPFYCHWVEKNVPTHLASATARRSARLCTVCWNGPLLEEQFKAEKEMEGSGWSPVVLCCVLVRCWSCLAQSPCVTSQGFLFSKRSSGAWRACVITELARTFFQGQAVHVMICSLTTYGGRLFIQKVQTLVPRVILR